MAEFLSDQSDAGTPPSPDFDTRKPDPADSQKRDRFVPMASWATYDFANTVYSGIVVTFFLSIYLTDELGLPATYFGVTTTLSLIAAGFLSPFLGSIPDRTGKTKLYCLILTVVCILCTAAISGWALPAVILGAYFLANITYQLAMVFYNALLPTVASPKRQGMVSGMGVALGYIGVILALLIAKQFILPAEMGDPGDQLDSWKIAGTNSQNSDNGRLHVSTEKSDSAQGVIYTVHFYRGEERTHDQRVATAATEPGAQLPQILTLSSLIKDHPLTGSVRLCRFDGPNATTQVRETLRWVFVVAAVLFLLFTLPLAIFVPERKVAQPEPFSLSVAWHGLSSVWTTVKTLPANRNLLLFLVGNILCVDVLNTAIAWFSKYFKSVFAFTFDQIIVLGLGMSGSAFVAGLLMGKITDKIGSKPTVVAAAISLTLCLLAVGLIPVSNLALGTIFSVGAVGLAGLWVAGRKLLIELAPAERLGEFFGLYGITTKISVFGTTVFAVLIDVLPWTESINYRVAILVQLVLIIPGVACLWMIRASKPGVPKDTT